MAEEKVVNEQAKQEKPKGDKVLKAIKELEDKSIDLVFFDPFLRFNSKDGQSKFKTSDERDKHIKRVQKWLKAVQPKLTKKANVIVGANAFSMSSFGDKVQEDATLVKRVISWFDEEKRYKDLPLDRGYIPAPVWFLWWVNGKGWVHNLMPNESFFKSEVVTSDPYVFTSEIVKRFSDEGETVLEIYGNGDYIQKSVLEEGRNYKKILVKGVND